jgi:hypothetical protein
VYLAGNSSSLAQDFWLANARRMQSCSGNGPIASIAADRWIAAAIAVLAVARTDDAIFPKMASSSQDGQEKAWPSSAKWPS